MKKIKSALISLSDKTLEPMGHCYADSPLHTYHNSYGDYARAFLIGGERPMDAINSL